MTISYFTFDYYSESDVSSPPDYCDDQHELQTMFMSANVYRLVFPLTRFWGFLDCPDGHSPPAGHNRVIQEYYRALWAGRNDFVGLLIDNHVVTADTTGFVNESPLLVAALTGNIPLVRVLIERGADVNGLGGVTEMEYDVTDVKYPELLELQRRSPRVRRTPLQIAAARGDLPMVKLLMETYHADDALVAPDGQVAFKLAVRNEQDPVFAYLPRRRGFEMRDSGFQYVIPWRLFVANTALLTKLGELGLDIGPFGLYTAPTETQDETEFLKWIFIDWEGHD
jgi:hypothetical protein